MSPDLDVLLGYVPILFGASAVPLILLGVSAGIRAMADVGYGSDKPIEPRRRASYDVDAAVRELEAQRFGVDEQPPARPRLALEKTPYKGPTDLLRGRADPRRGPCPHCGARQAGRPDDPRAGGPCCYGFLTERTFG